MTPMRRSLFLRALALGLAAPALAGCSSITGAVKGAVNKTMNLVTFRGTRVDWKVVVIAAAEGANQNSAVAVDFVFVHDEATIEKVAALPASKWFATRAELARTFPGTLSYRSWEVSPGQVLRLPGETFNAPVVEAVFVFADYLAPGEHRMRVELLRDGIIVQLGARGFTVSPYRAE